MQTTLTKTIPEELEKQVDLDTNLINHFLECHKEWKQLKQNSKMKERLKQFESMHGIAFMQLLSFFENLVGGKE